MIHQSNPPPGQQNVVPFLPKPYLGTQDAPPPPVNPYGGGDGGGDEMEARMQRLEGRVDKLVDDVGEVKVGLGTLTERVRHLPSKGYIDSRILGMLAIIAALVLFSEKIQALVS
jgi:hypothetical protein